MTNHGKSDNATILNHSKGKIYLMCDSIYTGIISVRTHNGICLWQKSGCTINDIPFAIEILEREIQTNVFETD